MTKADSPRKNSFTVQEAARILGASDRNIRFWLGAGRVVKAAIDPGTRRTPKQLSFLNLVELAVTQVLTKYGLPLSVIRQAVATIGRRGVAFGPEPKSLRGLYFEDNGKGWGLLTCMASARDAAEQARMEQHYVGDVIAPAVMRSRMMIVVNLTNIIRELERAR